MSCHAMQFLKVVNYHRKREGMVIRMLTQKMMKSKKVILGRAWRSWGLMKGWEKTEKAILGSMNSMCVACLIDTIDMSNTRVDIYV